MKKRDIVTDAPPSPQAPLPEHPHPLVGARFMLGAAGESQLPTEGAPEVAFAGRSNAGKSSAINALANHGKLAFASRTPGRTQQINLFALRSGAIVADLPGYGYAAVAKSLKRDWQEFLWRYVSTRQQLVALVLLVDARHGVSAHDWPVLDAIVPTGRPVLILATKADKLNRNEQRVALASIVSQVGARFRHGNVKVQLFSATTRLGVEEAESTIAGWL
ncbi:MAG: ribosome biogenesis GTP-binding protein YihA/YsxC [Burkholderiales bacterium]